jgi:putative Holliday junction resolvase
MINYLGVDWGEKRIGLALANSENKIATPFNTINTISELLEIIEAEEISEVVIGLPQKMDGDKANNPKFLKFVEILSEKLETRKIKISFIDERLTSIQADSLTFDKMKQDRDSLSAMIILQAYLDKLYD